MKLIRNTDHFIENVTECQMKMAVNVETSALISLRFPSKYAVH